MCKYTHLLNGYLKNIKAELISSLNRLMVQKCKFTNLHFYTYSDRILFYVVSGDHTNYSIFSIK